MQTTRSISSSRRAGVQRANRPRNDDNAWFRAEAEKFEDWYSKQGLHDKALLEEEQKAAAYTDRQESRRYANWLIQYHKTLKKGSDRHIAVLSILAQHLLNNDEIKPLYAALREIYADLPKQIDKTVFVNPDGSRFESRDVNFNKAKAAFVKRHNLKDEFVSVDRVQLEGQNRSKVVISTRTPSDKKPSSYVDPHPEFTDLGYMPTKAYLYMMPIGTEPEGSHRLTVREFERALIGGAEIAEDEDLSFNEIQDDRVSIPEQGYGNHGRTFESLSEEEQVIYNTLSGIGAMEARMGDVNHPAFAAAAELMLLGNSSEVDFTQLLKDDGVELFMALQSLAEYDSHNDTQCVKLFIDMMKKPYRGSDATMKSATADVRNMVNEAFQINLDVFKKLAYLNWK